MSKKCFYYLIFLVLFQSCVKYDYRLSVFNNTDTVLYFTVSQDYNYKENSYDASFSKNLKPKDYTRRLLPNSSKIVRNFGENSWVKYIDKSKKKRLNVYFFTESIILNNTWEDIYENKLYVGHNEYDLEELEKINWEVIFPQP